MVSRYIHIVLTLAIFTIATPGCRQEPKAIETESREQISSTGTVTSINPSEDQLLLGMMQSYFLAYNPTTDVKLSYSLPQYLSDKKCYIVYKLSDNEYLIGKRDSGITYLQYPDTTVDGMFQYSKVVTLSSNNDSKPYRGTHFSLYCLTSSACGTLLAGTSNGLLIISPEDIEAIRQAPTQTTYKIHYHPELKPYRDNHKQHAIEDIIANDDYKRFIIITDNGLFRLEYNDDGFNHTVILDGELPESISPDIHDARHDKSHTPERQARYWGGYVDGKTLHAIKKSPNDPDEKIQVSINDIFNTGDALINETKPEKESPVKLYREQASILSNGNIHTRYGTLDARATYVGNQSIALAGNDLYYISDGHLCRIDLKWVELTGTCQSSPLSVIGHDNNEAFILHNKRLYAINNDNTQNYLGPFDSKVIPAGGAVLGDSIYFYTSEKAYSLSNDINKYATERTPHSLNINLSDNTDRIECLGTNGSRLLVGTRISMIEYNPADGSYFSYKIEYKDKDSSQYVNPYYTAISHPYAVTLNNGIFRFNDDHSLEQLNLPLIDDMRSVQHQGNNLLVTNPSAAYLIDTHDLSIDTLTSSDYNNRNRYTVLSASFTDPTHITVVSTDSILNYVINKGRVMPAPGSCANTDNINRLIVLGGKPMLISSYNLINGHQLTADNKMLSNVIWTTILIILAIVLVSGLGLWLWRKKRRNHERMSKLESTVQQANQEKIELGRKNLELEDVVKRKNQEMMDKDSEMERERQLSTGLLKHRKEAKTILNDLKDYPGTQFKANYETLNKIDIDNTDDLTLHGYLADINDKIENYINQVLSLKKSFYNSLFNTAQDKQLTSHGSEFKKILNEFADKVSEIPDDWVKMDTHEKFTLMEKAISNYETLKTEVIPYLTAPDNPLDENRDMRRDILYGCSPCNAALPGPLFDNNNPKRVEANFDAFICYMFSNMDTKQIRSSVLQQAEYYKDVDVKFEDSRKVQMYAVFTTRPTSIIPKFLTDVISAEILGQEDTTRLPKTIYDLIWLNLTQETRQMRRTDLKNYLENKGKKNNSTK